MSPHVRPQRRLRHLVLATAVAAATLPLVSGTPAAAATTPDQLDCPDGSPRCVVVKFVKTIDGRETVQRTATVTPDDIREWTDFDDSRQYLKRRSLDGKLSKGPRIKAGTGVTIHTLLKQIDAQHPNGVQLADKVTFSETPGADGPLKVLDDRDLGDPEAPYNANKPYPFDEQLAPAFYVDYRGKIGYVRPLRDQTTDINAPDLFTSWRRITLTVNTTGRLLEPTVTSSKGVDVTTKDDSTFSISFATEPKTRIQPTWDFGDGTTEGTARQEPVHTYAKRGTYPVSVTVRGANGSYGRSDALEIKVDKPPKPVETPGTGDSGTGDGGGGGFDDGGYVPPYEPPYDPGYEDAPPIDEPPAEAPVETPEDVDPTPVDDGLEPVEGYVLAGSEIVPGGTPEEIPGTRDSSAPEPATHEALSTRAAAWLIAAFTIVALLGAGAIGETRWFRTRLRHLRRRA